MMGLILALSMCQVEIKVPDNPGARQHVEVDVTPTQQPTPLVPQANYYSQQPQQQVAMVPVQMVPVVPVYYRALRPYPVEVRGILGFHRGYRWVWR